MRFCIECGSQLSENSRFCNSCGTPVEEDKLENQFVQPNNFKKPNKKVIACSISSFVIVVLVAVGIFYYSYSQKNVISSLSGGNAQQVIEKISSSGAAVKVVKKFSAKNKGEVLSIKGIKKGEKISPSSRITVYESLGPGVPDDITKLKPEDAVRELKKMNVPVKVHTATAINPGTVIGTTPQPGSSINESADRTIHVLVGTEGKGVPADLYGMDFAKAEDLLKSRGFKDVKTKERLSSRNNMYKIVDSDPALGTETTSDSITLYYGVGAGQSLFTESSDTYDDHILMDAMKLDSFVGLWCTNSGDCLDFRLEPFNPQDPDYKILNLHGSHEKDYINMRKADNVSTYTGLNLNNELHMCHANQNVVGCSVNYPPREENYMRNHLIYGDTGVVELYRGGFETFCGNSEFDDITGDKCVNGKLYKTGDYGYDYLDTLNKDPGINHGLSFRMADFYLLVPVGADLIKLEKDGYFQGVGKNKPNMDRPFILRRDPKLYKKTEEPIKPAKTIDSFLNPFIPSYKTKPVKFAPAPDDDNAYYLVEQPFNWNKLPEKQ